MATSENSVGNNAVTRLANTTRRADNDNNNAPDLEFEAEQDRWLEAEQDRWLEAEQDRWLEEQENIQDRKIKQQLAAECCC